MTVQKAYDSYQVDEGTRVSYNADLIYIDLHRDKMFPAVVSRTVVVRENPLISVQILSDLIVGIEISTKGAS